MKNQPASITPAMMITPITTSMVRTRGFTLGHYDAPGSTPRAKTAGRRHEGICVANVSRMTVEPEIAAFAQWWNDGNFFTAHEVLEGLWVRRRDDGLQGLIQLAVALYQIDRGNLAGAKTMIQRAHRRLSNPANAPCPIDLEIMQAYAADVAWALDAGQAETIIARRPRLSVLQ